MLEIGTGLGVSTRAMAESENSMNAAGNAHMIVTLDTDPWVQQEVWPALALRPNIRCGMDQFNAWVPFDMVFIDGDHRYDAVTKDLRRARSCTRPFAPIVLHDYLAEVAKAADETEGFQVLKQYHTACDLAVGVFVD